MKVLITGGATWIKVDEVRVITNIFTGRTALYLANHFHRRGAKVTLLINPSYGLGLPCGIVKNKDLNNVLYRKEVQGKKSGWPLKVARLSCPFRVVNFRYYEELQSELTKELKRNTYDAIIHTAGVSDYRLKRGFKGKIPSHKKKLIWELVPTPKLTKLIRKKAGRAYLIQFKLENSPFRLIDKAYKSLIDNDFDLVVANAYQDLKKEYKAFIIDRGKRIKEVSSLSLLATHLFKYIQRALLP